MATASKLVLLSDLGGTNCRFELRRVTTEPGSSDGDELVFSASYPTVAADAPPGSGSGFEGVPL